jgi:hypothetical protein
MNYFAHSPKDGFEAQTYARTYMRRTLFGCIDIAREAGEYSPKPTEKRFCRQLRRKRRNITISESSTKKTRTRVCPAKVQGKIAAGQSCGCRSRALA